MKAGTRKSHTKSRNGCSHCRKARVKCSAQAPRCARCTSRNLQCDFEDDRTLSRMLRPSRIQHSIILPSLSPLPLSIEQRSLFHHFVSSTCESMITDNTTSWFWKMDVPSEALHCNYLLSAILALTTLHKAQVQSSDSLSPHTNLRSEINRSLGLHHDSLSQFTASVSSITHQNIAPALALAALSAAYSCALAQLLPTMTAADHVDQAVAIVVSLYKALRLFRGNKPWMTNSGVEIEDHDGPDMVEKKGKKDLGDLTLKARKLRMINDLYCDNDDEKATYNTAITAFLDIHAHWTMKVPSEYIDLLQQKRLVALLILDVFVFEDIKGGKEKVPWFMSVWKEGLRDFVRHHLGLLWTLYCELDLQDKLPHDDAYNDTISTMEMKTKDVRAVGYRRVDGY